MNITIRQEIKEPWGRLNIEDVSTAAKVLSGDTFKTWVLLALNQDGYTWTGSMSQKSEMELTANGYLFSSGEDRFIFDSASSEKCLLPEAWKKVIALYPSYTSQDYRFVLEKLEVVHVMERMDDIFGYWVDKHGDLQRVDHTRTKNPLRYDFSIILLWWLRENFKFEIGDTIIAGRNGQNLRFKSDNVKTEVCKALTTHQTDTFPIRDRNIGFWNRHFAAGHVELKLEDIGAIIQSRGHF